jgi:hypothetical protein
MLRLPLLLVSLLALSVAVTACVPYHPQPGQYSYEYAPVPGAGGR